MRFSKTLYFERRMVKISDPLMSKKYGHRTPPGLGFFRKGNYLKFDGKIEPFIIKYLYLYNLSVLPRLSLQNMAHEEIQISFLLQAKALILKTKVFTEQS